MVKPRQENEHPYDDDRNGAFWMLQTAMRRTSDEGLQSRHFLALTRSPATELQLLFLVCIRFTFLFQTSINWDIVVANEALEGARLMCSTRFNILI